MEKVHPWCGQPSDQGRLKNRTEQGRHQISGTINQLLKNGVNQDLVDTVKARKLAYYGHTMRKQGSCLEKEIMQGTMPGARRRGRPRTDISLGQFRNMLKSYLFRF